MTGGVFSSVIKKSREREIAWGKRKKRKKTMQVLHNPVKLLVREEHWIQKG